MRYDINVEYDLTDKGEQLFQAYKEGGLENIVAGKEFGAKSAYAVLAHTTTFTFLMAIDGGVSTKEVHTQLTVRQPARIVDIVETTFDSMVREGLITEVDEVSDTPLPSAFRKDFGKYE